MQIDVTHTLDMLESGIRLIEADEVDKDAVVRLLKLTVADVKEIERQREEAQADYERIKNNWSSQGKLIDSAVAAATEIEGLAKKISVMGIPF